MLERFCVEKAEQKGMRRDELTASESQPTERRIVHGKGRKKTWRKADWSVRYYPAEGKRLSWPEIMDPTGSRSQPRCWNDGRNSPRRAGNSNSSTAWLQRKSYACSRLLRNQQATKDVVFAAAAASEAGWWQLITSVWSCEETLLLHATELQRNNFTTIIQRRPTDLASD